MSPTRRVRVWMVAVLALGTALWLRLRDPAARAPGERPSAPAAPERTRPNAPPPASEGARSRAHVLRAAPGVSAPPVLGRSEHEHEHAKTHPITSDHVRLYRDVDLLHAADRAIADGDYDGARSLLVQHHRELRGMSVVEEEGLLLLADCAEERTPDNVARVQSFYDEHTDSSVRRRLRRACLEAEDVRTR